MLLAYRLAESPAARLAAEEIRTKGFRAVFAVVLMFGMLSGGVWLLLQSSFGPKVAYYISSVAFWGCWLVLSLLWLTGVPGLKVGGLEIPASTPKYYGPQGNDGSWTALATPEDKEKFPPVPADRLLAITPDITDQGTLGEKSAAETAAQDVAPRIYADLLDVGAADIQVPTVIVPSRTEVAKDGGRIRWARVTFGPATAEPTNSSFTNDLIARIEPITVDLYREEGDLAVPTYYSIALFTLLFVVHLGLLVREELKDTPGPVGSPESAAA